MTHDEAIAWQARLFPAVKWTHEDENVIEGYEHRPTLPEICLDLRRSLNGAADPWPAEFLSDVVAMLQARLATWETPTDAMDAHVRGMVWQAIFLATAAEAERLTEQSS